MEGKEGLDRHGLRPTWVQFLSDLSSLVFCSRCFELPKPVALDWGFPVRCLSVVDALRGQGVQPWWFTGDRLFARINYLKAKGPDPVPFNIGCRKPEMTNHSRIAPKSA